MSTGRWIIVSNRLPFGKDPQSGGLIQSSGGLISAIIGIRLDNKKVWVGSVPPDLTPGEWKQSTERKTSSSTDYVPLFIPRDIYEQYYNGFANDVLWPLFHYESGRVRFSWKDWEAYREVNEKFADAVCNVVGPDDLVWVHDFHLFLVPYFLRRRSPNMKIGFFLHIPFPTSEIFRQLPVREQILESLLCADLVGFHDYSYLRHFCTSVHMVLGIESSLLRIKVGARTVGLGVFPVSIDVKRFLESSKSGQVKQLARKFEKGVKSEHIVLGVDRLDYTKGILKKLMAFREMLRRHPDLRGKVSLLQVAIPSRTDVSEYIQIKSRIDMRVGEINGEFGTVNYVPVYYLFCSVSFEELVALYRLSDILLVTSKRDGMNLVCLEYLAAQDPSDPGEILLSEFAGASSTLSHVTLINPWDTVGTGEAIAKALRTPSKERISKHNVMMKFLERYTATDWARSFMLSLEVKTEFVSPKTRGAIGREDSKVIIPPELKETLKKAPVLLILDYDGTLVPIVDSPPLAVLTHRAVAALKALLKKNVEIVVVSGRDSRFLDEQFKGLDEISLAAEHGAKVYSGKHKKWQTLVHTERRSWYPIAFKIMEDYAARVPGSFVEKKEFSVSWHFRRSPAEFANYQARKLEEDLLVALAPFPASIQPAKKVIEARAIEGDKGFFLRWYLETLLPNNDRTAVAIGDDQEDEELFAAVTDSGLTIKVGEEDSRAYYRIPSQEDVVPFLEELARLLPPVEGGR